MAMRENGISDFTETPTSMRWTYPSLGNVFNEIPVRPQFPTETDVDYHLFRLGKKTGCSNFRAKENATIRQKYEAQREGIAAYLRGEFRVRAGTSEDSVFAEMLTILYGYDLKTARAKMAKFSRAQKDAFAIKPRPAEIIAQIRARNVEGIDTDEMENELAQIPDGE